MPDISPARAAALTALSAWRGGARAEDALAGVSAKHVLDRRDRALAHELFYGAIRNLLRLDHILSTFIKRRPAEVDPVVRDALRVAVYQLVFLDRVPAHAAVNDAVEQAKKAGGRGAASFANGVLRAVLRGMDKVSYPDMALDPAGYLSLMQSFPLWLTRRWVARYGPEGAAGLMAASNSVPPLTLRVNTLRTTRDELSALMREAGVETENAVFASQGLVVRTGTPVGELPGYAEGLFAVQDEAAQLVSILLGPKPGELVLDACAAPGGKAAHVFELSGGGAGVIAADISLDKSRLMKENITRLGASGVHPAVFDSSAPLPLRGRFDRVLLDAPCSALGIIRRRPEVKYARRDADIGRLAGLQSAMLENASGRLRPGGVLVYSTCTTEPEEGEGVVEGFLAGRAGFVLEDAGEFLPPEAGRMVTDGGYMRSLPHLHGTDGFFAARIRRVG